MATVYGPDTDVYLSVTTKPGDGLWDALDLFLRMVPTVPYVPNDGTVNLWNGYKLELVDWGSGNARWAIHKLTNDSYNGSVISSTTVRALADGDGIGFRVVGTTLTAHHRQSGVWTQVLSVTDASHAAAGFIGWYMPGNFNDNDATNPGYYDDFGGGTTAAGTFPDTPVLDDFTRADASTLGGDWEGFVTTGTGGQSAGISTNRATNTDFTITGNHFWGYLFGASDIRGSFVAGVSGTVTATRAVLFSLDGNVNTNDTPGLFKIAGDLEVTGTSTLAAGSIALDDLSDVTIAGPSLFQVLVYSGSAWVNTDAVGQILRASGTLTNAQMLALPTTPVDLVSVPGAGLRLDLVRLVLFGDYSGGASYTNIGATASLVVTLGGNDVSSYLANNPVTPTLTDATDFLTKTGSGRPFTEFRPWLVNPEDTVSGWGSLSRGESDAGYRVNAALALAMYNDALGNLTGGHANNTVNWAMYYTVEAS